VEVEFMKVVYQQGLPWTDGQINDEEGTHLEGHKEGMGSERWPRGRGWRPGLLSIMTQYTRRTAGRVGE